MVPRDLFDAAIADLVESRVADMANRGRPILEDGNGEHACHALPLRASGSQAMNLVVCNRDRFANALANRAGLALESLAQHAERDVGSFSASRLPADAIDDDEHPARLVNVEAILVDHTPQAGIGGAGGRDRAERWHTRFSCAPFSTATSARQPRRRAR